MPEQQNTEYKQSWHDDYLKWICGFANAQGGVIFIGKDDNGNTTGISDYKRLLDDIPNKVRNYLGITVEANLHEENGKYFIEIITYPYTVPISLRGRYYYRSGSTKQELTGASLNEFLLKKSGKTWDDVIEPRADFSDIDEETVKIFLEASENAGRLPAGNRDLSLEDLFEKLRLTENNQLKRGAVILFGKDPARFYPNTFVKIGRFGDSDADLRFHEVEEGNLIQLLDKILDQLNYKFLIKKVSFEGIHRIENYEYPFPAIREMILNALIHRNFMGAPTQIRVYDDKISIWNEGMLPYDLSEEKLKHTHPSRPRNPLIAETCFKGGYIDAWGRGTIKILETCKEMALPQPEMKEDSGGFSTILFKGNLEEKPEISLIHLNERQQKALDYLKEKGRITNKEYQKLFEISRETATRDLTDLVKKNLIESSGIKGGGAYYKIVAS